jgi:putative ABC transport system permease protein
MTTLPEMSLLSLLLSAFPLVLAGGVFLHMTGKLKPLAWAGCRMLGQLLVIGQMLVFIFALTEPLWVLCILAIMFSGAAWIAVRPIRQARVALWPAVVAVVVAAAVHLVWIVGVVVVTPWFQPSVVIPLAGMVVSAGMNAVSLCAERYWSDRQRGQQQTVATEAAFGAAMIPQLNALMAVGVVSLPGMMTGQILSGVSPLVAVRYQIMIMAMSVGTAALGAFIFLKCTQRWENIRMQIDASMGAGAVGDVGDVKTCHN